MNGFDSSSLPACKFHIVDLNERLGPAMLHLPIPGCALEQVAKAGFSDAVEVLLEHPGIMGVHRPETDRAQPPRRGVAKEV
jgi:hypothetical protein